MNTIKIRNDYKNLFIYIDIIALIMIISNAILNILNLGKVLYLYIATGVIIIMALFYFIASLFYSAKKKTLIDQEDNNLLFYSSNYIKNPLLKRLSIIFDSLLILSTLFIAYYYYGKMEFYKVETPYMLFILSFIVFVEFYYLIEDVRLYQGIDRIDAVNNDIKLSSLGKKIIFILIFISFSILNIGILSVHGTNTHFTVHYNDLVIIELLIALSLVISLTNLFISKFYYSKFEVKQISQKPFDNKIMEVLGEGKHAIVYKAYVPSLDTVFALKKLKSLDSESILRFEREFKTLKSLDNNNLVKVYTYNELDLEYIMDYMPYTLNEFILNNNISTKTKLDITYQILQGLSYLHKHNIYHRDLSLGNIMVKTNESFDNEYIIKITDFGVSKDLNIPQMTITRSFEINSTLLDPSLTSFNEYKPINDIYSLAQIINFIFYKTISIVNNNSFISNLIIKCMDINIANRYQTVDEISKIISINETKILEEEDLYNA